MKWFAKLLVMLVVASLLVVPFAGTVAANEPPTQEEVKAAIEKGVAWLADQQNDDGYWGDWEPCAVTALAVKKLEHHAVDPKWGLGLDSPFDDASPYKDNVERGLNWLLENCASTIDIWDQPAGDPDTNNNGIGVCFVGLTGLRTYTTAAALMALCEAVDMDRVVESGPLAGWTYAEVTEDTMNYLAFGQNDAGWERGGWAYSANDVGWSDQSNSGYAAVALGFYEAASPYGCGGTVPQFVKDELEVWINYIQCPDGGSGYDWPFGSNILRTGNLLQELAFIGATEADARVQSALGYMCNHWYDANWDPGWMGPPVASYQATFTAMKGFTSLGIHELPCGIDWQEDFETVLLEQQLDDGSWPRTLWDYGETPILSTIWALLTLQKVAPPFQVPVDIKPQSCPNPLNVKAKGVLPVAILGTADFDVTQVDVTTVLLEGVSPLRWELEDVATPFEPFIGKEACDQCTTEGPDGYLDLTLKFDTQEIVSALGDVSDGDCVVLHLTGNLLDGMPIVGEDVVLILKKGGGGG